MIFPSNFFEILFGCKGIHARGTNEYKLIEGISKCMIESSQLSKETVNEIDFAEYGTLIFPFKSFGAISSLQLFGLDELIIFSYYLTQKNKVKKAVDIGANIGLHTILMSKLGWNVDCYEPDPVHMGILKENISLNGCTNINTINKAVYREEKIMQFTRVKGNTTGSHITGMKEDVYGETDKFEVECANILDIIDSVDLLKIDAEGAEGEIISTIPEEKLEKMIIVAEVSTEASKKQLIDYFYKKKNINVFSQKNNWDKVMDLEDLPVTYKEGSIIICGENKVF